MKNRFKIVAALVFTSFSSLLAQAPANDNCSGATPLVVGAPPPCGTGLQVGPNTVVAGNITNATPGNPYIYQPGCSGAGGPNQAFPANDVWYSFVATGYQAVITINSTFANPNIAFYSGTCAALGGGIGGCAVGAGGTVTLTVNQMVPGTTYFLQVSGNTGQTGTFNMSIHNNKDCADCLVSSNITANPLPVNGTYAPGQTVNFCFHVGQYNTINTNWLHGVQLTLGSGWNAASIVPNAPTPVGGAGSWSYYPAGIGVVNAVNWGPGWYFDWAPLDANPGNNFGDNMCGATPGCSDISTAAQWNFCMNITTNPLCSPGSNLSVTFNTSGDGESGSWNNAGCATDNPAVFNAIGSCCPPNMSSIPANCFGTNTGSATATPVGAAGPYTYNWAGPAAFTATSTGVAGANSIANVVSGVYTVTIIDANLCAVSSTVLVTQPTSVTATPSFTNAGCTTNGTASVTAGGGTPGYTYTWSPVGGNAPSASVPVGLYTVTVQDSKLCTRTATYNIGLTGAVSAAFTTPTYTQCITGNSFVFTAADPTGVHSYSFNPVAGAPPVGNTDVYGPVSFTSPGTYTVTHSIVVGGCSAVTTSVIVIDPIPVPIIGSNSPVCIGTSILLTSGGGTSFAWAGPNGAIPSVQNPTITNSTLLDGGVYTVTVGALTCFNTATVNVIVTSPTTSAANTGPYCAGSTIQLTTLGATTYTWSGPVGYIANVQNPTRPNSTVVMGGTYTVIATIGTCTALATTDVTVNPLPAPVIASNGPICFGQDINLTGNGGTVYQWNGPSLFTSALQNPTITAANISNSGIYTLTVMDGNNCTNTITLNVVVNAQPIVTATGATVCAGNNANLNATGGTGYAWTGPNGFNSAVQNPVIVAATPAEEGQYTVTVTDANTCTNTAVANVTTSPLPSPTLTSNGPLCMGAVLSLTAAGGTSYQWTGPNNYAGTSSTFTLSTSIPSVNVSGVYSATVSNQIGCKTATTINVVVNALPTLTLSSDKKTGCAPLCINYSVNATGAIQNYNWILSSDIPFNNNVPKAYGCYSSAGIYTITSLVTDNNGCQNATSYTIEVYPKPIADFDYSPDKPIINVNNEVFFTDLSHGATITSWNWYFMSTPQYQSSYQNPSFIYPDVAQYLAALVVKSNKGCMDTVLKLITIGEDFGIWIPNAFTPNDDKVNNVFEPIGYGITKYNMLIFDRWGEKIYNNVNSSKGWDGYKDGVLCKDDVYTYKILVTNVYNAQKEYVGHVTLVR